MLMKWTENKKLATSYYNLVKNVLLPNAQSMNEIQYYESKIKEYEAIYGK